MRVKRILVVDDEPTILAAVATNPERFIAEHNIDRYEQTGLLDTDYLLSLSPDVE